MRRLFSLVVSLLAVVFIVMGVRWLIAPEGIAPEFGLILGDGLGLSSQIGDMSGYFLFLGISCLLYTSPSPRDQRGSRMPSSA